MSEGHLNYGLFISFQILDSYEQALAQSQTAKMGLGGNQKITLFFFFLTFP